MIAAEGGVVSGGRGGAMGESMDGDQVQAAVWKAALLLACCLRRRKRLKSRQMARWALGHRILHCSACAGRTQVCAPVAE